MRNRVLSVRFSMASTRESTKAVLNLSNKDCLASVHLYSECYPVRSVRGCSNVSIASYISDVIICMAKKLLNLFLGLRLRPLANSFYFLRISTNTLRRYNIPKVIYGVQARIILQLLSTELVLLQILQNLMKVLLML